MHFHIFKKNFNLSHIRSRFSIKDLENFSGVKSHTIRIWEKRYALLSPERTDTNIRYYSLESLKKLLNISLLNGEGIKISKIAAYDADTFDKVLKEIVFDKVNKNQFINQWKIAMLNYDVALFEEAYNKIAEVLSFSDIFKNYLIPFLGDIGLLWQSGSINPTHEHFISNLIRQKILIITYHLQLKEVKKKEKLFVLFLPDNEVHDLGLNYLQYEILNAGYKSIMLGASVPIHSLKPFINDEQEVVFISYFTVEPQLDKIPEYFEKFTNEILINNKAKFHVLGKQISLLDKDIKIQKQITLYHSLDDIIKEVKT